MKATSLHVVLRIDVLRVKGGTLSAGGSQGEDGECWRQPRGAR